jgi:hypothetical protein
MTSLIPIGQEWTDIKNMGSVLVASGFLPKAVDTAQKACAIMLLSRELGIGPMEGFSKINVIQGKPTISPELMKAMVHKKLPQAIFKLKSSDDKQCTFAAARPGDEPVEFTFTIEEAIALGLRDKDNWKKQPKTMLRWRCIAQVCRVVFPDCISGISYGPEELGAVVTEDGEVIDLPESKPTTIAEINREEQKKSEDELAKKLRGEIIAKIVEHEKRGHKKESLLEAIYIKNVNELFEMTNEKLSGILDHILELENK